MMQENLKTADYTDDFLLGGRVLVRQPKQGYRVAIDPIFLGASVQVNAGETVLDVGTGVGAASLCLAYRQIHARIVAVEVLRDQMRMAVDNVMQNEMRDRIEVLHGDLMSPPPRLAAGTFSHVIANPPYLEAARGRISTNVIKATSNHESSAEFDQWARFCLLMVKPKGSVTFVYTADRLDEMLAYFSGKLGDIVVYPLWPGKGKPAKRVIVRGYKNTHGPLRLMPGMQLHKEDGQYTDEAEAILRHAQFLDIEKV